MDIEDSDSPLSEIDDDALERLAREYEGYILADETFKRRQQSKRRTRTSGEGSNVATLGRSSRFPSKAEHESGGEKRRTRRPDDGTNPCISALGGLPLLTATNEPTEQIGLEISVNYALLVDPGHLAISKSLTERLPLEQRCLPTGVPRVWSDTRQALYETLPYFKKAQGGCQQNDGHVFAFLFDGSGHDREYMDEDVVIARATGGMVIGDDGNMVQGRDQAMSDANVQAIQNDMLCNNPLIIICGQHHDGVHVRLPYRYCVLGWYKAVAVWAEKSRGGGRRTWTTVKFRFERLDSQQVPWHQRRDLIKQEHDRVAASRLPLVVRVCHYCQRSSSQIYLEIWTCLHASCPAFWKIGGGVDAPVIGLHYHPGFIAHRTRWTNEEAPYDVRPPLPDVGHIIGDNLAYINTRGVVCPQCGRCNSRHLFRKWVCDNPECEWQGFEPVHDPILPSSLHSPWDFVGEGPSLARNRHHECIELDVSYVSGYKVCTYRFPGTDGCFIHAISNRHINGYKHGPDEMLVAMQTMDIGLQRGRFARSNPSYIKRRQKAAPVEKDRPNDTNADPETTRPHEQGGDYMVAFAANYGMPYKFAAKCATRSFDGSPWPVRACRSRLNWARRTLLGKEATADFNELLVLAYMEGQKIEYHDDGEDGLGSCIASMSLGCKARMSLRMKAKHYIGCSKSGVLTREPPLPMIWGGPDMYERRLAALEEIKRLQIEDSTGIAKRLKDLPHELGLYDRRNKHADDLLTVTLSHGDIMIMEGHDLQRYLEHRVVPDGFLRFALTGRDILSSHLEECERPLYIVRPDDWTGDDDSTMMR